MEEAKGEVEATIMSERGLRISAICLFPKCKKKAYGTYAQIPLCKKHLELAEFICWLLSELDKP